MVVKQQNGVVVRLGEIADVQLAPRTTIRNVRFNGQLLPSWESGFSTANSLDVIKEVRKQIPAIQAQLPAGMTVGISLRLHRLHSGCDQRSLAYPG